MEMVSQKEEIGEIRNGWNSSCFSWEIGRGINLIGSVSCRKFAEDKRSLNLAKG